MKKDVLWPLIILLVLTIILVNSCGVNNQSTQEETGTIYYVQTNVGNMPAQLQIGEIDAFVAWEPFNAQAVSKGIGRYLLHSGEILSEHPCCVLALSKITGDEELALALTWAHVQAINFINNTDNHEKTIQYAMEFTGMDQRSVLEGLKYIQFVSAPHKDHLQSFLAAMRRNGTLVKEPASSGYQDDQAFIQDLFNDQYLQRVKTEMSKDPAWVAPMIIGSKNVNLGYIHQDMHHLPMYIAIKEGYYQKVGLIPEHNLRIKGYVNGVAIMEAFKAKELTAAYLGVAPAILKRLNDGIEIGIIAGANNEGSAIVVGINSPIRTVKDLENRTVAIPGMGTVQSYILEQAANQNNFHLKAKQK